MEKDVTSLLFIFSRFPQRGAPFPEVLQDKVCPWSEQVKVTSESEVAQSCLTLSNPTDCSLPTRLLCPCDFPGKSTGVGCHCLLQRNYAIGPQTLMCREEGSFPCVFGKEFPAFPSHLKSSRSPLEWRDMNFPPSTAFIVSHRFWIVVFHFHSFLCIF